MLRNNFITPMIVKLIEAKRQSLQKKKKNQTK